MRWRSTEQNPRRVWLFSHGWALATRETMSRHPSNEKLMLFGKVTARFELYRSRRTLQQAQDSYASGANEVEVRYVLRLRAFGATLMTSGFSN
jgi:hypothetical protein